MAEKEQTLGHVVQVIGPVVDVQFPEHHLPHIYNLLGRICDERGIEREADPPIRWIDFDGMSN